MQANWPSLAQEMGNWGFDSPLSCIGAIGNAAKESSFAVVREAWWLSSNAARKAWYLDTSKHAPYSGGPGFHGRALTQSTHDYNYRAVQTMFLQKYGMHVDLLSDPDGWEYGRTGGPELLMRIEYAAPAYCKFWADHRLNSVSERQDWAGVRKAVYGAADADGTARIQRCANKLIPLARARGFL